MELNDSFPNHNETPDTSQERPNFDWPKLRKAIGFYERERLRYFPVMWGAKNPAINSWKPFQSRAPTLEEKATWFHEGKPTGIAIVCGAASGGLVALCFNDPGGAEEFFGPELWQRLLTSTFVSKTPRGHHVLLRSDTPINSQFIRKGDNESWLEIRSDGNYIVAPPSLHPIGTLYQDIGVDRIYKPKDLAGFIDKRLAELGLKAHDTREAPKGMAKPSAGESLQRSDQFNELAIEKLLGNCAFVQHCRDDAAVLSEHHWWSMISILISFGDLGKQKVHELSQPYPEYTVEETDKKIEWALKAREEEKGPHLCDFIKDSLGFSCPANCLAKKWGLKSPVVLATRLASEGLHITIDGVTYFERLDLNRIICRIPQVKEDKPPSTKTLASFIIEPKIRITLEGESERLDTVLKTGNTEYPCLFKREAWNSKRQLLAALPNVDLQYYGTDKDTQAILAMVTSKELPIRRGTTVLGRNGDLWVLRDGVISQDGWVENPPLVYIPSEVEFDRRVHYPVPEDETALIKQIIPQLFILNEGRIIFPILGWFFATPFVPEVRHRLRHFPLLVVWGTHGGGKSSLLSLLWELFGVKSELFSATETPFTFLRLFSGTSTVPIIIDEFKPFTMKEDETRLLIRFLRRLYDGEIEHRGRPDLSLVAYHLQAPTAIAGEVTPIALESAMGERVIQVNLNPDTLTAGSLYVSAFNELSRLDMGGFAFPYIRWCLGANLDDLMAEAQALLPAILREVPPRVKDNALVMTTGLVALERFSNRYGVQIAEEAFRTGITESISELLVELFERGAYQEIGLTIFLETLATLAQTGRIKHGVHYTTDDINTRLYIHLPDCLAEFRKFVRETSARVEVLDERAYRRQAREVCERKGYVLNTFANKWFKTYKTEKGEMGKIRSCMEIDLEQLPFDTSGFEEPVGD